jgi:hypothetical protein
MALCGGVIRSGVCFKGVIITPLWKTDLFLNKFTAICLKKLYVNLYTYSFANTNYDLGTGVGLVVFFSYPEIFSIAMQGEDRFIGM